MNRNLKCGWTNLLPVFDDRHEIEPDFALRVALDASLNVDCSSLEPLRLGTGLEQNRALLQAVELVHVASDPHIRDEVERVVVYRARGPFLIDNKRLRSVPRKSQAHNATARSTLRCAGQPQCKDNTHKGMLNTQNTWHSYCGPCERASPRPEQALASGAAWRPTNERT